MGRSLKKKEKKKAESNFYFILIVHDKNIYKTTNYCHWKIITIIEVITDYNFYNGNNFSNLWLTR